MSETNVRSRRVSGRQLDLLWEFLNANKEIATGYNRSLQAKEHSLRKWREITNVLNAQGDGANKDWKAWSKYWVDYKAKLKKRVAAIHLSRRRTGGGPSMEPPLSTYEEKFLSVLGEDFGQGLAGVRVEPFPESSATTVGTNISQSILQDVPIDDHGHQSLDEQVEAVQMHSHSEHVDENVTEQVERVITPVHSPPPAQPPLENLIRRSSPRRSRSGRQGYISREEARRLLIESAQERTRAAVRSSEAMEGIHRVLENFSTTIASMNDTLEEIKRVLATAFPRAAE